jgi:dTDP-glucose 4,6-dehydratase
MRLLILGGGSAFALALARHALALGHEVSGIGRSAQKPEHLWLGADRMGYKYLRAHIVEQHDHVADLIYWIDPEVIVNFAAQGESGASFDPKTAWYYFATNATALARLIPHFGSRLFIQVGSSEVYGSSLLPLSEEAPLKATSPYAISKGAFDQFLLSMQGKICPFMIVRPSNCYTAGQQLYRIIPKALLYGLSGKKLPLAGGEQRKSFLDADDLSRAIMLLIDKGQRGEVYNVGPDAPTSIRRIVELCAESMGLPMEELIEQQPPRYGEDGCYFLDSSKIKKLGWRQEVAQPEGIGKVRDWVAEHLAALQGERTTFEIRP